MNFEIKQTPQKLSMFINYLETKDVVLSESEKKSLESIFTEIADTDKSGSLETHQEKGKFWMGIIQNWDKKEEQRGRELGDMFFNFLTETFNNDYKKSQEAKKDSV